MSVSEHRDLSVLDSLAMVGRSSRVNVEFSDMDAYIAAWNTLTFSQLMY